MKKLLTTAAFALATTMTGNANAGLVGDTVDVAMIRTISDSWLPAGRLMGFGLDAPFVVVNGLSDQKQYSSAFKVNVDDWSFDVDFLSSNSWVEGTTLRLSGLNFVPGEIVPFQLFIDTNLDGLTWKTGSDWVEFLFTNVRQTPSSYIVGRFQVPEPGTLLLVMAGLGASGALARRRS